MKKILVAALLLCCPATAHAGVTPPVGATVGPYTLEAGDRWTNLGTQPSNTGTTFDVANGVVRTPYNVLQWGSSGCDTVDLPGGPDLQGVCELVPGTIVTWRAERLHRYRKTNPWLVATVQRFYAIESSEVITTRANDQYVERSDLNTPDCNASGDYGSWVIPWGPGPKGLGAHPDAPDDFAAACGLPRPTSSDPAPPTVQVGTDEKVVAVAPQAARSCPAITYQRKRVAITARTTSCTAGRTIMARYLARGIEPRGWVCVTARLGRSKAATCAAPARSRAARALPRVTAVWRAA